MKKYISIMMLAARNSIYKIMGLLVVTGAVQLGAVRLIADRQTDWEWVRYGFLLDSHSPMNWAALPGGISLVLLCILLLYPECESGGSKIHYSINRLQVSEKGIFFIWMIFSTV